MRSCGLFLQGTSRGVGKSLILTALAYFFQREGQKILPLKVLEDGPLKRIDENNYVSSSIWSLCKGMGYRVYKEMNPFYYQRDSIYLYHQPLWNKGDSLRERIKEEMGEIIGGSSRDHTLILVEGTGSPGDIHDERRALSTAILKGSTSLPIILITDIHRGGSFSSLYGTLELLSSQEQERVKGFLFNGFSGKKEHLLSGIQWLEERTSIPVLGVLPYLPRDLLKGYREGRRESIEEIGERLLSSLDSLSLQKILNNR